MNVIDVLSAGPYNLAYAGGLFLGLALATWQAHRRKWPLLPWLALLAACIAGGIVGSRLLHLDGHVGGPGEKTILGGITGGMLVLVIVQRWLRTPADASRALAPSLLLGFAVGRIGCFLVGCCFGLPASVPWAVSYGPGSHAYEAQRAAGLLEAGALTSLPVHPTQLYEAALAALLALVLWRCAAKLRASGAPALALLAGYGAIRFVVDFQRASGAGDLVLGLKVVQWTVALVALAAAGALLMRERDARRKSVPPPTIASVDATSRSIMLLGVLFVLVWLGGGWFTLLEQTVLFLAALPALVVALRVPLRNTVWRAAPALAAGALVVVPMPQDTLRRQPTSYVTVGTSAAVGDFETWRDLSPEDDCGASETRLHDYRVFGVSGAYTRAASPTGAMSVRLGTFFGTNRIRVQDQGEGDAPIRGVALSVTGDGDWLGVTGGFVAGKTIDRQGLPSSSPQLIGGLRVGQLHGLHGEVRVNDHEPSPYPDTRLTVSLGYGFGQWRGTAVRAGLWEDRPFLGARLVTRGGTEIEPFLGLGAEDGHQYGLAIRHRIPLRGRAAASASRNTSATGAARNARCLPGHDDARGSCATHHDDVAVLAQECRLPSERRSSPERSVKAP